MGWALPLSDREWALQNVENFPRSWQARLLERWRHEHHRDRVRGNRGLLHRARTLADSARGGIRPDAGDADICTQADITASDMVRRLGLVESNAQARGARPEAVARLQAFYVRALLRARGLLDLWPCKKRQRDRRPALLRVSCARWWRRAYRKLHARTVEACAIDLGLVRSTAGIYASDDGVRRRGAQTARHAAALESVTAVNEYGQEFKLSDLVAKGTGNKAIRRVELLTRIAGFELIAKDCDHIAFMVTVTCPSRFHPCTRRADRRVIDNPKWDGSQPRDAQRYLSKQWSRCRTAAARAGLEWYGFRIAEPQHDSTPHWHMLLFMPPSADGIDSAVLLKALIRRYFLENESPNEPGAQKRRVDFEMIDWRKGSAVGYVIKYISKNIDGYGVGLDLFGNDAITSSARVEAWASIWRIRQFQQFGGAPVGVWRELRRVNPDQLAQEGTPAPLREALIAVNVAKTEPGVQAIAWKRYTELQGGTGVKRTALAVKLVKEATGEIGRYGEAMAARALGVVAAGVEFFRNHIHQMRPSAPDFQRATTWTVHSERAEWVIGQGVDSVRAAAARVFQRSGEAASTRIHVNNCTDPFYATRSEFAPTVRTLSKLRRFARRNAPPGGPPGNST